MGRWQQALGLVPLLARKRPSSANPTPCAAQKPGGRSLLPPPPRSPLHCRTQPNASSTPAWAEEARHCRGRAQRQALGRSRESLEAAWPHRSGWTCDFIPLQLRDSSAEADAHIGRIVFTHNRRFSHPRVKQGTFKLMNSSLQQVSECTGGLRQTMSTQFQRDGISCYPAPAQQREQTGYNRSQCGLFRWGTQDRCRQAPRPSARHALCSARHRGIREAFWFAFSCQRTAASAPLFPQT